MRILKSLLEVGYDTLKKCIDRYIADKPSWQSYQHGSTFFEKGYIDYLDENYLENSDIKKSGKGDNRMAVIGSEQEIKKTIEIMKPDNQLF